MKKTNLSPFIVIGTGSILVFIFIFWILYFREGDYIAIDSWTKSLSSINAGLNFLTTILLILGFIEIKRENKIYHTRYMVSAIALSILFLISYLTYHYFVGHVPFAAVESYKRNIYFFILITHIICAMILVPIASILIYHAIKENHEVHKKLGRWVFPVWLYVSSTGVIIYLLLKIWN